MNPKPVLGPLLHAGTMVRIHLPPAKSRVNSGTDVEGRRIRWCDDESTKCSGSSQLAPPNTRSCAGSFIAVAPVSFDAFVRRRVPWHRPEDHAHMLEGLRKAGWREG